MQQVKLYINVTRTLEIVYELKQMGWIMGTDFDFAYYKSEWDSFGHEPPSQQYTMFTFYNDSNASYFTLKWS